MEVIQRTISDLLPNPQILNFHAGSPTLPAWVGHGLRLMMGAGDMNHGGIPNVQLFATYDVFFCMPWDDRGSLRTNIEYLLANCPNKLICFIDAKSFEQMALFTKLFAGRFSFIDGHGGHCPHLTPSNAQNVLVDGGVATNMFEWSDNVVSPEQFEGWLQQGYFAGISSLSFITGRVYGIDDAKEAEFKRRLIDKMREISSSNSQIKLDAELDGLLTEIPFRELTGITHCLLFDYVCPPNMVGSWVNMMKDWQDSVHRHFLFTKVPFDVSKVDDASIRLGPLHPSVARARRLVDAIQNDLVTGFTLGAKRKFETFNKLEFP